MSQVEKFDYHTHYQSVFQKFIKENHCPLLEFRKRAFEFFDAKGFPSQKVEDWRFTNCYEIADKEFVSSNEKVSLTNADIEQFIFEGLDVIKLVLVNGSFSPELSTLSETGISVTPISQMLFNHDSRLEKLGTLQSCEEDVFSALNSTFFRDGFFIDIANNSKLDKPIQIINIEHDRTPQTFNAVRHFISVGENANVKIVNSQHSVSSESDTLINEVSELKVAKNADVEFISIQQADQSHRYFSHLSADLAENSNLVTNHIDFGGKLVRHNQTIRLTESNANAEAYGVYIGHDKQQIDNYLFVEHISPGCTSNQLFRGILTDKSKGVFKGRVKVDRQAQKTDAMQSSKALLLSDDAQSHNMPQLEIYADDVRCTHGATVGELDKDALFYLKSRGISEEKAQRILTIAFAEEVVDNLSIESVRQTVYSLIDQSLSTDL